MGLRGGRDHRRDVVPRVPGSPRLRYSWREKPQGNDSHDGPAPGHRHVFRHDRYGAGEHVRHPCLEPGIRACRQRNRLQRHRQHQRCGRYSVSRTSRGIGTRQWPQTPHGDDRGNRVTCLSDCRRADRARDGDVQHGIDRHEHVQRGRHPGAAIGHDLPDRDAAVDAAGPADCVRHHRPAPDPPAQSSLMTGTGIPRRP